MRIKWLQTGSHDVHLAVVVPCYEVEQLVESVVAGIPSFVQTIILVDDASPGETPKIVDRIATAQPERIIALHHEINQGVGGATLTGMRHAVAIGADIVIKMDGDGQMNPDYLPDLIEPLVNGIADFTKGNRFTSVDVLRKMPVFRLIGNAGLSFLNRLASGYWNTLDPTNGFFALRTELVVRLLSLSLYPQSVKPSNHQEFVKTVGGGGDRQALNSDTFEKHLNKRFFFESSLLIELGILRAVVRDVPMSAIYGNEISHLSISKALFEFPPKLIAGFFRRIWCTKFLLTTAPDFILGALGIVLFLFGSGFGLYHWITSLLENKAATPGTVMLAALPCVLGMQMILSAILIDIQSVPTTPICPINKKRR